MISRLVRSSHIKAKVPLNEPGDYAKVAKLVVAKLIFDLPILTEAPAVK